ncbi:GNAT family N-acetyltransferase [Ruania alba]|nr:GNAT family N-acetyltransferase [Ruania alba]
MVQVRDAVGEDVPAICAFGEAHIPPHYTPLIGAEAAHTQVRTWWSPEHVRDAVARRTIVVAEEAGAVVGVAQCGRYGADTVIYKLYVHPDLRGRGIGPDLVAALEARLPDGTGRLWIEHFAANTRAAAFYDREGFVVDHVDEDPSAIPALAVVWRVRPVRKNPGAPSVAPHITRRS